MNEGTAVPLSARLPIIIAEAERRGMRVPFVVSVISINGSAVTVSFRGGSPYSFDLVCGSVTKDGYALPASVLIQDSRGVTLLARLGAGGGHDLLFVPGGRLL